MIRILATLTLALLAPLPALAEVLPQPGSTNPRLQTVRWRAGETVLLTMLPRTALIVMLEPGEKVRNITVSDRSRWDVTVTAEEDSLQVAPLAEGMPGTLLVETDRREYRFGLRTDVGLTAAYLVRFDFGELPAGDAFAPRTPMTAMAVPTSAVTKSAWTMRGDRAVRPLSISDDGTRITVAFGPDQALPAVFATGPTGGEEVVNGYMRGDVYVIDRLYDELVFRIDRERATARRQASPR